MRRWLAALIVGAVVSASGLGACGSFGTTETTPPLPDGGGDRELVEDRSAAGDAVDEVTSPAILDGGTDDAPITIEAGADGGGGGTCFDFTTGLQGFVVTG